MSEAAARPRPAQTKGTPDQDSVTGQSSLPFDLAIVVVSWNTRDILADCLRSVEAEFEDSRLSGRLWVVDNASTDGTVTMLRRDFPQVALIACAENLGFAAANNVALKAIGFVDAAREPGPPPAIGQTGPQRLESPLPDAVLLLNPDTKLHPGTLRRLTEFMQSTPRAGLVGTRLVFGDGSFQHSAFAFPGVWQLAIELLPVPGRLLESALNGRYPRQLYDSGQAFKVGHPLGAAMCVRREAIEQVGFLDEGFHMYVEEIDWSLRLKAGGWEAYCLPEAVITHYGGQSTGQIRTRSFVQLWTSRHRFYRKHYGPRKVWLAGQIVQLGMKRLALRDNRAAARGELSESERAERTAGYEQVVRIWQNKDK